jgi:hypothetical protein
MPKSKFFLDNDSLECNYGRKWIGIKNSYFLLNEDSVNEKFLVRET